jgi:hypothetical protein
MKKILLSVLSLVVLSACNVSDVKDAIDVADGVPRKTIDTDILGVNAFANDGRFGSPASQYQEVRSTLRLGFVRILVNWDAGAQPSPTTPANLAFYDTLIEALPSGIDAVLVMTGVPSWLAGSSGDPRSAYINDWVTPVVTRYGNHPRVIGFQIWNEPNQNNSANSVMGFTNNAALYVSTLKSAAGVIRTVAPSKLVVTAATTAINQNYPSTLNYNRDMRDAGAQSYADIWGVHYYGKQYENVIRPGGVADFANGLSLPIWVTESGAQGVNNQLAYGEEVWPFLQEKIHGIQRIYVYQFTEATAPATTYGLKNLSLTLPVSDLYVWLRERK